MTAATAAPGIVAPATRDLSELAAALAGWLGERMPDARGIRVANLAYPLGAGMSHETILFDAEWQEGGEARRRGLVVRIKPTGDNTVYQDDMFEPQYRLMRLMHETSEVRVAEPLWLEPDPALLGAPFFVMEKVAGRVAVSYPPYSRQGWLVDDASPADRRRMWEDSVTQLAAIQRVDPATAPFLAMPGRPAGFEQEIDRWQRCMEWIDPVGELTLLREGYDRLLAAVPSNRPDGIVWGDARLGNMMIGADYRVAAVMDWEQPSLGGALHDLGWWLLSDSSATVNQGVAPLDGMGTREETIALWERVSGKSAADVAWYETFVVFKQECLGTRMAKTRDMSSKSAPWTPGTRIRAALDRL
jgi:aminoglycoside phosphotransferase (APT) family kinase protein